MHILLSATVLILLAGVVQAGDWAGPYAGGQAGQINSDANSNGGETSYGLHGGYNFDFGTLILGGEVEFARMRLTLNNGAGTLRNVSRVKLRAGRDFGPTMAYAVVGGVSGDTGTGSDTGVVYGFGLSAELNNRFTLSGEALRQEFDNFANSGSDLNADSFNVRVSFRF